VNGWNLFVFFFWQSNGKAEKFFGDFDWLEAGRESNNPRVGWIWFALRFVRQSAGLVDFRFGP
jgi:hypothetical protein